MSLAISGRFELWPDTNLGVEGNSC